MIKRCRYCGEKIQPDDIQCCHCGKSLGKPTAKIEDRGPTSLDSWKEKRIPSWVMYSIVGLAGFCVILMVIEGCNK